MRITKRETAFEGEYLRLVRKTSITNTDTEIIWETVERTNVYGRGVVGVVALTQEGELILIRHWRAGIESYVVQFPGGLTDIEGESEEETASREFLEETGYFAKKLIPIMPVPVCPVLTSLEANYYFAPEAEFVGRENKDVAEEIEVLTIPRNSLHRFLSNLPDDTKLDLRVPGIIWILEAKGLIL